MSELRVFSHSVTRLQHDALQLTQAYDDDPDIPHALRGHLEKLQKLPRTNISYFGHLLTYMYGKMYEYVK